LDQINPQKASYEAQTGLAVVAAYCDPAHDMIDEGYTLVLEGFGTSMPQKRLHVFHVSTGIMGPMTSPEVLAAIQSAVSNAGGVVTLVESSEVFFYDSGMVNIIADRLAWYPTTDECVFEKPRAQAIYEKGGLSKVSAFCLPSSAEDTQSGHLLVIGEGWRSFSSDQAFKSIEYSSFMECSNDRERVIQNEVSNGRAVAGALCEPSLRGDLGKYVIETFYLSN
jgi:hypothetical protein